MSASTFLAAVLDSIYGKFLRTEYSQANQGNKAEMSEDGVKSWYNRFAYRKLIEERRAVIQRKEGFESAKRFRTKGAPTTNTNTSIEKHIEELDKMIASLQTLIDQKTIRLPACFPEPQTPVENPGNHRSPTSVSAN